MIVHNINPKKLFNELEKADITPVRFIYKTIDNEYFITEEANIIFSDDTDMELAQQIINAHDPTPLPPQPTQDD